MSKHESIGKWFSTIHRYSMIYKSRSFQPMGIGAGQLEFLAVLYQKDGISQDELAQMLNIDKTTTARAVQKLESSGFIRRVQSEQDRRMNHVYLTQKSVDLLPGIQSAMQAWTEILMQGFTTNEREMLLGMLNRISDNAVDHICKSGGDHAP